MVKKMDNYSQRTNDSRFEKFDRLIEPNSNDRKFAVIVSIGVIVCMMLAAATLIGDAQKPATLKYAQGLNISYDPESSLYYIDYSNPMNDTKSMSIDVQIPYTTTDMLSVYTTQTNKFPSNISYKPSNTDLPHTVSVNIMKENGNYTYFFTNTPIEEDRLYDGFYKYTKPVSTLVFK